MNLLRNLALLLSLSGLMACAGESYDPDADSELAIAGGKADGIFDIIPEIAFDMEKTGRVAGDDIDFYRIDLRSCRRGRGHDGCHLG